MLQNYFKIAWRNLQKNKGFSFINILGLALGIACSVLIFLWVTDERSVDAFHKNKAQLYTLYETQFYDGKIESARSTPGVLPAELKKVFPEVQYASGYASDEENTFQAGDKKVKQSGNYAGADFFKMYSYPLLQGTPQSALSSIESIAISRKMAESFFSNPQNAIGKTVRFNDAQDFKVTAVFENLPENTSVKFDYLINWDAYLQLNEWAKDWGNNGPQTQIMLQAGADADAFNSKIKNFIEKYNNQRDEGVRIELAIQPFDEVYLHSNFVNGVVAGGRIEYVNLFTVVAIVILLIACINFMNLTTARSVKRAKEIGIRKVVGAVKGSLVFQFIGEAIFITFCAAITALVFVVIFLPAFNSLTGKQIDIPVNHFNFWASLAGLVLITGLISGSYPALVLSSFKSINVLKGGLKFSNSAIFFRKGLVVCQFILSIVLILGTIVVSRQVDYIKTINLGYNRKNLVYVPLEGSLPLKYNVFKNKASKIPGIADITRMSQSPTLIQSSTGGVDWIGKDTTVNIEFTQASVGYDFIKTMNGKIIQGRDFSKDFATDSVGYILNEEAAKRIGYKESVGQPLTFWGRKGTIIGIMQNFHFNSLHEPVQPMILRHGEEETYGVALLRIEAGKTKEALAGLENIIKELNPAFPFTYQFSDEEYTKLYNSEQVVSRLANYFAFLAIFISCLGLLGLAVFTAQQRTREIGIRKVLGASVGSLFGLLSKQFLVLVFIAFLIAVPIAWGVMNNWLQDYAYRITISWWMFLIAGAFAIAIALITVSFQAIRAAVANPVKSLRTE
jgi:ABC-type antimicrobial peptide transport system permease subunit